MSTNLESGVQNCDGKLWQLHDGHLPVDLNHLLVVLQLVGLNLGAETNVL